MANKYRMKFSTFLAPKEMKIKMTLRSHLIPVRIAIIIITNNNKCWLGCEERESSYPVVGIANWCNHYGNQYGSSLQY
jgi:hypothetical protein